MDENISCNVEMRRGTRSTEEKGDHSVSFPGIIKKLMKMETSFLSERASVAPTLSFDIHLGTIV
jgi:hypothetical protein